MYFPNLAQKSVYVVKNISKLCAEIERKSLNDKGKASFKTSFNAGALWHNNHAHFCVAFTIYVKIGDYTNRSRGNAFPSQTLSHVLTPRIIPVKSLRTLFSVASTY